MKKAIAIALILAMMMSLAACSSGSGTAPSATAQAPTTDAETKAPEQTTAADTEPETAKESVLDPSWQEIRILNAISGIELVTYLPEGEWNFDSDSLPSAHTVYYVDREVDGEWVCVNIELDTTDNEDGLEWYTTADDVAETSLVDGNGYFGVTFESFGDTVYDLILGEYPYDPAYSVSVRYSFPMEFESENAKALLEELMEALVAAPRFEKYDNGFNGLADDIGFIRYPDSFTYNGTEIDLKCKEGTLGGVTAEYEGEDGITYHLRTRGGYTAGSSFVYYYRKDDTIQLDFEDYVAIEIIFDGYVEVHVLINNDMYVKYQCAFIEGGSTDTAVELIHALFNSAKDMVEIDKTWITSGLYDR